MVSTFEQWRVPIGLFLAGCFLFLAYLIPNYINYSIHFRKKLDQLLRTYPELRLSQPLRFHGFAGSGLGKEDKSNDPSYMFLPFGLLWVAELSDKDKTVILEAWKWFSTSRYGKDPSHFFLIEQTDDRSGGSHAFWETSRVTQKMLEKLNVQKVSFRAILTATNCFDAMSGGQTMPVERPNLEP